MINNISNVDTQIQRMSVAKSMTSHISVATPPILSFSAGFIKEKAILRVKKIKRGDNIAVVGVIDDDYVDSVEEEREVNNSGYSFFKAEPVKFKVKYLKNLFKRYIAFFGKSVL